MPIHQFRRKPNKSEKTPLCGNRTHDLMVISLIPLQMVELVHGRETLTRRFSLFFCLIIIHLSNLELNYHHFSSLFNQAILSIKFTISIMNTTFPLYLILQIKNPKSKSIFPFSD
ncbi:hypothetical protein Hanom_Chr16g01495571 [Helianthus anomalus]